MPFQKGYKPPTAWVKGQKTPNPGGRPKGFKEFRELCRSHTPEAVERLVSIMRGEPHTSIKTVTTRSGATRERIERYTPPMHYQIEAAQTILERAYGKPVQPLAGEDGEGPVQVDHVIKQLVVHVRHDLERTEEQKRLEKSERARLIENKPRPLTIKKAGQ